MQFVLKSEDASASISHNQATSGDGGALHIQHDRSWAVFGNTNRGTIYGKKALRWMEKTHPEAFDRYEKALQNFRLDDLDEWIGYIKNTGRPDRQLPVSRTELDEEGNPYPLVYESGTDGDM